MSVELHKLGLLSNIDRASLAAYCSSYGLWIRAMRKLRKKELDDPEYGGLLSFSAKGNIMSEPLVGIANKAAADMVRYAEQFGMTPSARARVNGSESGNRSQDPAASYIG